MSPKLKLTEGDMLGFRVYINTEEPKNEIPHVHLSTGKGARSNDIKIRLDNFKVSGMRGDFSAKEINDGVNLVQINKDFLLQKYLEIHGMPMKRKKAAKRKPLKVGKT